MSHLARPREPYDRKHRASKPASMEHIRQGGWAEVCVGDWNGDNERRVFGHVAVVEGSTIYIRVADEVCSFAKTGLYDGDLVAVTLEDIFGSEFSPEAIEWEARRMQHEVENAIMDEYREEFDRRYPQYATGRKVEPQSEEEWDAWCRGKQAARQEFFDNLIPSGRV
jgi:hypothetical protein